MTFNVDFLASYDIDSLAAELRRIATLTGKNTVSSTDITRFGRVNVTTIYQKFGTISDANEAAGLVFRRNKRWTNHEIMKVIADLWKRTLEEEGRRPIRDDIKKYGLPFSIEVIVRHFGTWRKALIAASQLPEREFDEPPVVSRRRSSISVRRRYQVFKRDSYECRICHRTDAPLELDHIVPVCHGGSDQLDNLQTLCWDCNRGKGGSVQ